jgi:hypothetical protein
MIPNDATDRVCKAYKTRYYSGDPRDRIKGAGKSDSDLKIVENESTQWCRYAMLQIGATVVWVERDRPHGKPRLPPACPPVLLEILHVRVRSN